MSAWEGEQKPDHQGMQRKIQSPNPIMHSFLSHFLRGFIYLSGDVGKAGFSLYNTDTESRDFSWWESPKTQPEHR